MFASLCFGFFDPDALRRREVIVRRPLDSQQLHRLFGEWGSVQPAGGCVDGHVFLIHPEGFVETTCVLATRKALDFASRLVQETGCEIASAQFEGVLTLEALVSNYEQLAALFARPATQDSSPTSGSQVA